MIYNILKVLMHYTITREDAKEHKLDLTLMNER